MSTIPLDQSVPETIPAPGVWHSFNGRIYLGGFEIFRVSEALFVISNNAGVYYEVGSKYGIPYRRHTMVSFSIRRAFVNLYEFILSIGLTPQAGFIPGKKYSGADLGQAGRPLRLLDAILLNSNRVGEKSGGVGSPNDGRPNNHYPVKTDCKFIVNPDGVHSDSDLKGFTESYEQELEIGGVLLDLTQLNIGAAGELITSNPIEGIAEDAVMRVIVTPTGTSISG